MSIGLILVKIWFVFDLNAIVQTGVVRNVGH